MIKKRETFTNWFWAFAINIALLFGLMYVYIFHAFVNDDPTMNLIAENALGTGRSVLVFINYFISKFIELIYGLFPNLNGYNIVLYAGMLVSWTTITAVLFSQAGKHKSLALYIAPIFILEIFAMKSYYLMQFTIVAAVAIIAGFALLVKNGESIILCEDDLNNCAINRQYVSVWEIILAFALILFGTGVRSACIWSTFPMFGLYTLQYMYRMYKAAKKTSKAKQELKWYRRIPKMQVLFVILMAATLILAILLESISGYIYSRDPEWKDYFEFNKSRASIMDYKRNEYNGEDKADYDLLLGWFKGERCSPFLDDPDVYTAEKVAKWAQEVKVPKSLSKSIGVMAKEWTEYTSPYNYLHKSALMVLATMLLLLIFGKRKSNVLLLLFYLTLEYLTMAYRGRYRPYVNYGVLLAAVVAALVMYNPTDKVQKIIVKHKMVKSYGAVAVSASILLLLITNFPVFFNARNEKLAVKSNMAQIEFSFTHNLYSVLNNKENLYVLDGMVGCLYLQDGDMYNISAKSFVDENQLDNAILTGGWYSLSMATKAVARNYNVDNPIRALVEKDNVYFVTSGTREDMEYMVDYLHRHYQFNGEPILVGIHGKLFVYSFHQ